jgi:hypothetical protein
LGVVISPCCNSLVVYAITAITFGRIFDSEIRIACACLSALIRCIRCTSWFAYIKSPCTGIISITAYLHIIT